MSRLSQELSKWETLSTATSEAVSACHRFERASSGLPFKWHYSAAQIPIALPNRSTFTTELDPEDRAVVHDLAKHLRSEPFDLQAVRSIAFGICGMRPHRGIWATRFGLGLRPSAIAVALFANTKPESGHHIISLPVRPTNIEKIPHDVVAPIVEYANEISRIANSGALDLSVKYEM